MANRDDVRHPVDAVASLLLVCFAMTIASCSDGGAPSTQETVNRGQVFDQDTGQPIAGVIVVGRYRGSRGAEGATSCNRIESAVSDENGWFELPLDPRAGLLTMEGYHRSYRHGWPVRVAVCGIKGDGNANECQVWQERRDQTDQVVSVVKEPTIYQGEAEAEAAARERKDLYLKRFEGTREERIQRLWALVSASSCLAPPKTSPGPVPYLEAILEEQIALGDRPAAIESTRGYLETARRLQGAWK
jgi:hypothetical protein